MEGHNPGHSWDGEGEIKKVQFPSLALAELFQSVKTWGELWVNHNHEGEHCPMAFHSQHQWIRRGNIGLPAFPIKNFRRIPRLNQASVVGDFSRTSFARECF